MHGVEKEFKWDASARGAFKQFEEALGALVGALPSAQICHITDRYLDNEREEFSKRKVALRIRCQNGIFEATLKSKTALQNGLACRQEETLPLEGALRFAQALKKLQEKQTWHAMPLEGLNVRFMIKNNRKTYTVQYRGALCEAALDSYTIYAAGRQLSKREIELELKKGPEKDFMTLLQNLNQKTVLKPCVKSKVASAEELLKK